MKRIFSIISLICIVSIISGCDYYPWTPSTGTTNSDKIYLDPAIGDTRHVLQLSETVRSINYGASYFNGGPTFDSSKTINQIKSEIIMHNDLIVSDIRTNALLLEIPNTSIDINHLYIMMYTEYSGGKTWYVTEAKIIFETDEQYRLVLFPIYLLARNIPQNTSENILVENQNYDLLNSTIDDFINYYETINAFNFTYTENSITVSGMKNAGYKKINELITSYTLTFTDGKVSIDV